MKVHSCEELVARYWRVIQDHVKKETEDVAGEAFSNISAICSAFNLQEYDWKNSSEGFENWVLRKAESYDLPESAKIELLRLWKNHNDADEEWKAVYYACKDGRIDVEAWQRRALQAESEAFAAKSELARVSALLEMAQKTIREYEQEDNEKLRASGA